MRAYSINPHTKEVSEIDIEMQANTIFTFFNSILIDELAIIDKHTIYSDANAISKSKTPFLIGEQLIVGDVLIFGKDAFVDIDVMIPKDDLESLISYDISPFYTEALKLLETSDINLYKIFEVTKEKENAQLDTRWVLYVFNIADDKTKEYFLEELKKAVEAKKDIFTYMEKMAILALGAMDS